MPLARALFSLLVAATVVAAMPPESIADGSRLDEAQHLFYNAHYGAAAALALTLSASEADKLPAYELRTAALHFQIRQALGDQRDKSKALKECAPCAPLLEAFFSDVELGQALAHERLRVNPRDDEAQYFLGKIDLNYIWLQLETLGKRTGWGEYWEARKSLDAVLKRSPSHVRARVARAWIDYIVETKTPRGVRWVLGGGSKKRALAATRAAAVEADARRFERVEAEFALWDMLAREHNIPEALTMADKLAREFPENPKLITFLKTNGQQLPP